MPDILHRVGAVAPTTTVYNALATPTGIAAWWATATTGGCEIGETIESTFTHSETGEPVGTIQYAIEELVPDKRVAWRVTGGVPEWQDTLIRFDLEQADDGYTIVQFGHEGWAEPSEFMGHCTTKWGSFLMSLKSYVETGVGQPSPTDVQISNWH
ncbi:MAG: hypothetical protein NVSMB48_10080 [Marmoricola sp.]